MPFRAGGRRHAHAVHAALVLIQGNLLDQRLDDEPGDIGVGGVLLLLRGALAGGEGHVQPVAFFLA